MSFTTTCFINKNTPNLRDKLKELGYKFVPNDARNDRNTIGEN